MINNEYTNEKINKNSENKSSKDSGCNKILLLSFISAFAGFFIGLLVAPMPGNKFRKVLIEKIKDVVDRSKFAVIEARIKAEELLEKSIQAIKED